MQKIFMVDLDACTGCRICEVMCSFEKDEAVAPSRARIKILRLDDNGLDVPVVCQHCESPPCADVCPVHAIVKVEGKGVLLETERCVGCRACTLVCPYGAIQVDATTMKSVKCDTCGGDPACVRLCPKGALHYDSPEAVNTLRRHGRMRAVVKQLLKSMEP